MSLLRHVIEVEDFAILRVFHDNLRVQVALVLHDEPAGVARWLLFFSHRLAFDKILEANLATGLREDRNGVRVPFAEHVARLRDGVLFELDRRTHRHLVLLNLAAAVVDKADLAVTTKGNLFARFVDDRIELGELDDAPLLRLGVTIFDIPLGDTTDVEGPHRQLRARLANTLGGNDPHRHALFDHRTGRHVHAVA